MVTRRDCLKALGRAALAPLLAPPAGAAAAAPAIVDLAGRPVMLTGPARRIVLLDAPDMLSLALLLPDPAAVVVGWAGIDRFDSDVVRRQYQTRPDGGTIPVIGGQTGDTIAVERIMALRPDLVVASAHVEPELGAGQLTRRLEGAGIAVAFANVASNGANKGPADGDPLAEMARALRLWARLVGAPERAEAYIAFVQTRAAAVTARVAALAPTATYLEVQSTYDDCCWAAGRHVWGQLLARAGGRGPDAVKAEWYAKIAPEQLIAEAPAVYIASGGAFGGGIRPEIGPGLDPDRGRAGLRRLGARPALAPAPAVRDGRVHGIWTGLLSAAPLNILFLEIAARWLHPDHTRDISPEDTLAEINRHFLARPLPGPCWLSLASS